MNESASKRTRISWQIVVIAILSILLVAAVILFFVYNTHSITLITADGSVTYKVSALSAFEMPEPGSPEKLTFLGWADSKGNLEDRRSVRVYEDCVYTARYITALNSEEHIPYLFTDKAGLLHPNANFTRGEAAVAVYSLLSGKIKSEDTFYDVAKGSFCYDAVNQLKSLGVISGSRFYPDDGITWGELANLIAAFYPVNYGEKQPAFVESNHFAYHSFCTAVNNGWLESDAAVDPDGMLTRKEAAVFLNTVLGRKPDPSMTIGGTGVLPDCAPFDEAYIQLAEAAVAHSAEFDENGTETWTAGKDFAKHYSGYVIVDGRLRFADADGLFTIGYNADGFFFDDSGCFTSGNAELDSLVSAVLTEVTDENMSSLEMLKAAYDYVVKNCTYLRRNYYDTGETGWEIDEAVTMLSTKKGNCYDFAAAFWALARGLGYDAQAVSGICSPGTPHGWVIIRMDDYDYLFDPELENVGHIDRFMLTWSKYCPWGYSPEPEIK